MTALLPQQAMSHERATTGEQEHAACVLGRAFVDDPLFVTTLRDPVRRTASLPLVFRAMARQTADFGLMDHDEHGRGVALWIDGAHAAIRPFRMARYGYVQFGLTAGVRDALRLGAVQDDLTRRHAELVPQPHAYLFALGVEPTAQGQGVGSGLLRRGTERLDALGLDGYLETNLPQNVRLYERFGFEVVGHVDEHGFDTWLMVRPHR